MSVRSVLAQQPALDAALITPEPAPLLAPLVSPPLGEREADGLDLILEGFLLHHGKARHLAPADQGAAVLAGDYCYAHGLVRIAAAGDLFHIEILAELIALGASLAATDDHRLLVPLWRATTATMAARGGADEPRVVADYAGARDLLRSGDRAEASFRLSALAERLPPTPDLAEAFA